jgi:hypothetical protein
MAENIRTNTTKYKKKATWKISVATGRIFQKMLEQTLNPQYRAKGVMIVHDRRCVMDSSGWDASGMTKGSAAVFINGR